MNGHGHVIPNSDGSRTRCGGPGICDVCSREAAREWATISPGVKNQEIVELMLAHCRALDERDALRAERDAARAALRAALRDALLAERKVTDEMVSRFLCWKLPQDFEPDCGISFTPFHPNGTTRFEPVGTNLLTATQARQMLEHVLWPKEASK